MCLEYGIPDSAASTAVAVLYRKLAAAGDVRAGRLLDKVPQLAMTAGFFLTGAGESLAWTADSFYTGHKRLFSVLGWQVDRGPSHASRFYPFAQFDLHANRPDIVLERIGLVDPTLASAYRELHERRLARAGFSGIGRPADLHLPELKLAAHAPGGRTAGERVVVSIEARDDRFPLERLYLYINDVPFPHAAGIRLPRGKNRYTGTHTLELPPGPCRVQAAVRNNQGVDSLRETLSLLVPQGARRPILHLAAVGVSRYRNFLNERVPDTDFQAILDDVSRIDERVLLDCYLRDPGSGDWLLTSRAPLSRRQAAERVLRHFGYSRNLAFADKDARDLVRAWSRHPGRFSRVRSIVVQNEQALRERFAAIRRFFADSRPGDTAVLFLAGHGLRDEQGEYWFGTHDIDFQAPQRRGYRLEELDALFDGIAAVNRLLLIDTCFSGEDPGAANETRNRQLLQLRREVFAELARGAGSVVLASSAGFEAAYEGLQDGSGAMIENGIFTHALLGALGNSDTNSLPVSVLVDRVTEEVLRISGGKQMPGMRRERIEFDFPVR
jgi:hypothetical protein